jgi:predicted transcriptional regulator
MLDDNNYIVIKGWMINKLGLSGAALIIYAVVYGFSQDGKSFFRGGVAYLAACAGLSERNAQRILKELVKDGLIEKAQNVKSGRRYNDYTAVLPKDEGKQAKKQAENPPEMGDKTSEMGDKMSQMGDKMSEMGDKMSPHINIYYLKDHKENLAGQAGVKPDQLKNENPEEKTGRSGRSPPKTKKPPLLEREPENDYERVEKQWRLNYLDLFGEPPIDPAWSAIRSRLKRLFTKVPVEQILTALEAAKEDEWIMKNGYSLLKILAGDFLSKALHKPVNPRACAGKSESYDDWSNFGEKG